MVILVACEESQTVTKELRNLGHTAYSADIQEPSGGFPEWHILGDVLPLINGRCSFHTMDGELHSVTGKWDMIIAHPPCTYLSSAGACNLFDRDHNVINKERELKLWEAVAFFNQFLNADCDRIALENPAPMKYCGLPKYTQIIEPYYFGDPWKKRTCLWLKNLPCLEITNLVEPLGCWVEQSGRNCRTKLRGVKGVRSAKLRSKTFPGIARAMAEQFTSYEPLQLTLYDLERGVI